MSNLDRLARAFTATGRFSVSYIDDENPLHPLTVHSYRPVTYTPNRPVVFVQHGVLRNGDEYRDFWIDAADRHGFLVVAPTYAQAEWPGLESYNNGRIHDEEGKLRPLARWTYAIGARILADLRTAGICTGEAYLFGHSAGAQFVHRLLSSQSHAPWARVAAGNAGWYTLPTLDLPYPEGFGGVGLNEEHLLQLLACPLLILAGDRDIETSGEHLPSDPPAMRQGPHRFARAHHYFDAGRREAARRGVPCNWSLQTVPGIGHDGKAMSAVCASLWFTGSLPDAAEMQRLAGSLVA